MVVACQIYGPFHICFELDTRFMHCVIHGRFYRFKVMLFVEAARPRLWHLRLYLDSFEVQCKRLSYSDVSPLLP